MTGIDVVEKALSRAGAGLEELLTAFDRDQREAATAPPGPLLVVAGAGGGKFEVVRPAKT